MVFLVRYVEQAVSYRDATNIIQAVHPGLMRTELQKTMPLPGRIIMVRDASQ